MARIRLLRIGDVVLAVIFGGVVFVFLGIVSAGILEPLITAAAIIALFALGHYLFWGRFMSRQTGAATAPPAQARQAAPEDEFLLSLTEPERSELLQVLRDSLDSGKPQPGEPEEAKGVAIRRALLDKLRMFGA